MIFGVVPVRRWFRRAYPVARRLGVSKSGCQASSAGAQLRHTGSVVPRKQGGDRRSGRIEAEAEFILARIAARRDITLMELRAELLGRGVRVSIGALWRFFDRRRITLKKDSACGRTGPRRRAAAA